MKKILFLGCSSLSLSRYRYELIERMVASGADVTVSFPKGKEDFDFKGCKVEYLPLNRRGTNIVQDLRLLVSYFSLMKKCKPDIVLSYTIKPNLYGGLVCRILKIPYILTVTGLGVGPKMSGKLVSFVITILSKLVYKKAYAVFSQNQSISDHLHSINALAENEVRVPGSGVNLKAFPRLPYPPQNAPIAFVFTSRILKEKGIDEYLAAAKHLKKKYPATTYYVLGFIEQPEYKHILEEAQENQVIHYAGFQEDVIPFIKRSHCVVLPSFYPEGLSNVLLEGAACGRPIITTNMPGCRESTEDGVTGFLCKPKDAADLIDKMERFILTPYDEKVAMGLAGNEKMTREFDRALVIDKYCEVVDAVCREM